MRTSPPPPERSEVVVSVRVKLPTILRKHADGEPRVDADGATLRELLADLETHMRAVADEFDRLR
jgi:molybdopterin converting factor small subunit